MSWSLRFWEGLSPGLGHRTPCPASWLLSPLLWSERPACSGASAPASQACCHPGLTPGPVPSPLPTRRSRHGQNRGFSTASACGPGLVGAGALWEIPKLERVWRLWGADQGQCGWRVWREGQGTMGEEGQTAQGLWGAVKSQAEEGLRGVHPE